MSTDGDSTLSNTIDKLVPVTSDGNPIIWTDDNDAHIEGLLHEVGKFYRRTGRFQYFFKHHAAALPNGKLAVEDLQSAYIMSEKIKDDYSFEKPCPPTAQRVATYDAATKTIGSPFYGKKAIPTNLTEIPAELKDTTVLSEHAVELEDSKLLTSLTHVFGHSISSDELIDEADGSGYKLLTALRKRAANANTKDKALVAAQYARVIRDGVPSGTELTFKTLKDYIKEYKAIKRNVPPTSRQSDAAEVDMIDLIAVKDPSVREIYDIKRTATPPTNLDSAVGLLSSILRGRARCEEIDEVNSATASPAKSLGLVANRIAPNQDKALQQLLSTIGTSDGRLSALLSTLQAVADPAKTKAGEDKDKKPPVNVPRGADGKPTAWVEGMALCRCGVGGGKHLFKDCPKSKEKAAKKARKEALAAAPPIPGLLPSDAMAAISALLSQIVVNGGAVAGTGVESKSDSAYTFLRHRAPTPSRSTSVPPGDDEFGSRSTRRFAPVALV